MLEIRRNEALAPYTTIKIGLSAEFFAVIETKEELLEAIVWAKKNDREIFPLGGGSNLLLTKKIKALVIKNEIKGMKLVKDNKTNAIIESNSGELWSKLVSFSVGHKLYGLENLFLIPGTVGAAPMQNIGAYGVELKDSFHYLRAINLKTGQEKIFKAGDCQFAYRDSIFKKRLKGKYFIYSVAVKLGKKPNFKLDYGSIREQLISRGIKQPKLKDIITVIQDIRNSKLPNPVVLPNAGSFFRNPEISLGQFRKLQEKYPDIPNYPTKMKNRVKIPAAWLIEQAGFRGKRFGPVAMYEKQALILVNYNQAKPSQALFLVKKIKNTVKKMFGVELQEEVNII